MQTPRTPLGLLAIEPSWRDSSELDRPLRTAHSFARALNSTLLATSIATTSVSLSPAPTGSSDREIAVRLARRAKEQNASFIAVLTHLKPSLRFSGSCASLLHEMTDLPVLAINSASDSIEKFERLFVPTGFANPSEKTLASIVELASALGANLDLFAPTGTERLDPAESIQTHTDLILSHAERNRCDLIILESFRRPARSLRASNPIANILNASPLPVLIVSGG